MKSKAPLIVLMFDSPTPEADRNRTVEECGKVGLPFEILDAAPPYSVYIPGKPPILANYYKEEKNHAY